MNFSKKNHELVGQNEQNVKKSQKHDANLQKNSTLYFQVGLILTLLTTYALFEMQFEINLPEEITYEIDVPTDFYTKYLPEEIPEPVVKKMVKPIKKKLLAINLKPVSDDTQMKADIKEIITELPSTNTPLNPDDIKPLVEKPETPYSILGVEQVPIYPGCEGLSTNQKRRDCMSKKLGKLVSRKFNTDVVADLDLTKTQRIYVNFKIDKSGYVTDIRARNPHDLLKKEAEKVVRKIPQMIPGKMSNKNVEVMYTLPIFVQVQN